MGVATSNYDDYYILVLAYGDYSLLKYKNTDMAFSDQ